MCYINRVFRIIKFNINIMIMLLLKQIFKYWNFRIDSNDKKKKKSGVHYKDILLDTKRV